MGKLGSTSCLVAFALLLSVTSFASAKDNQSERGDPQLGYILAKEHCSRCHAIDKYEPSPLAIAPPFRDLHLRYPVEDLAESLGEGIRTGHPTMPEFRFDPDQIENFIAYLKTLEQ